MAQNAELKAQNVEMGMRLLEGDEDVLEDILWAFGPQISNFLIRKYTGCLNDADAEDILSMALFHLWEAREDYDESKGSIRSLLFKIADNVAKDVLKSGWRKAKKLEVDIESCVLRKTNVAEPCTAESGAIACLSEGDKKRLKDLKQIVSQLSEIQGHIIIADANAKDGKADSEYLAEELGIPPGTVRVNRNRALSRIKEELRKLGHKLP